MSRSMTMPRSLLIYFYLLLSIDSAAQVFGGHPPSHKWKQINTDSVRVIFPPGLEKEAADIVDITGALGRTTLPTIGNRTKKISIVLQNQTTNANGYVGLGPWRSEFFMTPMQNSFGLGSLPWHKTLALHEYRHVQQYNNFRKGVSRVGFYIFGEQVLALLNSTAVPDYFWEGDAVYQETVMSRQGRGRLPYFFNCYRSLWAASKDYSWLKLRNGSYRDYIPDHYQLGYLVVAYGREKYGDSLWATITDDAVRFRGLFYPWQHALKKHTGENYRSFRTAAFAYFRDTLNSGSLADSIADYAKSRKHFAGDEMFPQWIDRDNIVIVRSDYKNIPAFVVKSVSTGRYKKIRAKDISDDTYFSYKNGRIVYSAFTPDIRWGWRDYSGLRVVDINTGRQQNITIRSKYFSPDISKDGSKIVAVDVNGSGESALHILLLKKDSNAVVRVLENKQSLFYTFPKFTEDEKHVISAVRNQVGQMSLMKIDISNGSAENLTPWSFHTIGYPSVNRDTVSFTASVDGRDELMMLVGDKLLRLNTSAVNGITGNYGLTVSGGKLSWMAFSSVGYRIQVAADKLVESVEKQRVFGDSVVSFGISHPSSGFLESLKPGNYEITKYRKSHRLLNPHSFRPYLAEPDFKFSLISENVLNTFVSDIYVNYNSNERSTAFGANLNYGALFPWLRGGLKYTIDRRGLLNGNNVYWNEAEANAGMSLPLNLSRGRYFRRLTISSDYVVNARDFAGTFKDSFDNRSFGYSRSTVSFTNQVLTARQHIYPRFAQSLFLSYSKSLSSFEANQFLASGSFYLPGFFRNQSIVLNAAFQQRDTLRNAGFSNSFPYSRGYVAQNYHQMYKLGANYHFPIVYPDWGLGSIVYFLRIRGNIFYDYTKAYEYNSNSVKVNGTFRSVGGELFFDTKWWNQQAVTFGIRHSTLLDARNEASWEFILPIGLF